MSPCRPHAVPALVSARLPWAAPLANAPLWHTVGAPRPGDQPLPCERASGGRSPVGSRPATGPLAGPGEHRWLVTGRLRGWGGSEGAATNSLGGGRQAL